MKDTEVESKPQWIGWATTWLGSLLVVVAVFAGLTYVVVGGAPYSAAQNFIVAHEIVRIELGSVQQVRLSWPSSLSRSGSWGEGELTCYVKGDKGEGHVVVELRLRNYSWTVTQAELLVGDRHLALPID